LRQQRGGNIAGHRGARFQRGYGIGGIFKSLARYAIPIFKQGAKVVGKRALQAAREVGQDVLQEKNVRESVKTHVGDVVKDFAEHGAKGYSASNWAWMQEKAKPTQLFITCHEAKTGSPKTYQMDNG
jgi:hypothetical protein